ncbi:protein lethal(2)essential for life-like [Epargyreus clarus]|uniref:protein lethal(2)essential for life-like n=1 Tax=Epargyreus clarus TaxID=520877 RepID=UPI003C2E07EB
MSLLPYFFDYNLPQWPRRILDQNFGLALTPEDLVSAATSPVIPRFRMWWPKDTESSIKVEKDKWQINIDVQHFAPDEITVKIADGYVVVEGKHEEKQDEHGFVSRQFVRRFKFPEDSDANAIESRLSSDGVLTVLAPRKVDVQKGERNVPISHTGPVRKEIKDELVNVEDKEEK